MSRHDSAAYAFTKNSMICMRPVIEVETSECASGQNRGMFVKIHRDAMPVLQCAILHLPVAFSHRKTWRIL
eukprot:5829359-Amphidinium_carterae.1